MIAVDLQEVHDFLIDVAHRAGKMITEATPTAAGSGTKKNSADLVTETDQAVEKMVSTTLRENYPDYQCAYLLLLTNVFYANFVQLWVKRRTNPETH